MSSPAIVPDSRPRVAWSEIRLWFTPWVLGAAMALVFFLGLYVASQADDDGSYAIGFILAAVALIGLGWELWAGPARMLPTVLVDTTEGLIVVVALLGMLALVGLWLAARSPDASLHSVGYALFFVSAILIGWNLKHYFDVRERA